MIQYCIKIPGIIIKITINNKKKFNQILLMQRANLNLELY